MDIVKDQELLNQIKDDFDNNFKRGVGYKYDSIKSLIGKATMTSYSELRPKQGMIEIVTPRNPTEEVLLGTGYRLKKMEIVIIGTMTEIEYLFDFCQDTQIFLFSDDFLSSLDVNIFFDDTSPEYSYDRLSDDKNLTSFSIFMQILYKQNLNKE